MERSKAHGLKVGRNMNERFTWVLEAKWRKREVCGGYFKLNMLAISIRTPATL